MAAVSRQAAAEAGISTREAEVLALVGQHLSNAEIGPPESAARAAALADLGLAPMRVEGPA